MEKAFGLEIPQSLEEACEPRKLALLVYDMQVGILDQLPDPSAVSARVLETLKAARGAGVRVFFLRHGPRNALTAVPAASTIARLFVCGFTPFHDAAGLDFSLGFLGEVAGRVRCDELAFVPDRSAVEFARAS